VAVRRCDVSDTRYRACLQSVRSWLFAGGNNGDRTVAGWLDGDVEDLAREYIDDWLASGYSHDEVVDALIDTRRWLAGELDDGEEVRCE
jgi:hypothetical protein